MVVFWVVGAYLSGAVPWSVWLGALFFRVDPRVEHDGNPGAANAFRVAGWRLGGAVLVLDFLKAFLPVAAARWLAHFPEAQLFWIALMPTVGHAFSVFLRFHGGRGIVVMFGVWTGLTLYLVPTVLGFTALGGVLFLKNDELRALAIPTVLLTVLLAAHATIWMLLLALAQLLILAVKISVFLVAQHRQSDVDAQ